MFLFNFVGITYAVSSYVFCVICASYAPYAFCVSYVFFYYPSFDARLRPPRMLMARMVLAVRIVPVVSGVPSQFP